MSVELQCAAWHLQVAEPSSPDYASRLAAQEEYLGKHLAPWVLDDSPAMHDVHSWHIMRYIDAPHLAPIDGIAIVFRVLGFQAEMDRVAPETCGFLNQEVRSGALTRYEVIQPNPWTKSVIGDYGGSDVAEAWARFLAASSAMALHLLREPRCDFASRELIAANWAHCFSLITRGRG